MRTTITGSSARTGPSAARLVAALGVLLMTAGLLVFGAATGASATDKPEEEPPAAASTDNPSDNPSGKPSDRPTGTPTDKPSGKPSDKPTDKPGAPGNNGTVKLEGTELDDGTPQNQPHLPCTLFLEWYNFDSGHGTINSTVEFALHAPTNEANGVTMAVAGDTTPSFVGNGGQPGAGDGRDHVEEYTLSFTGPAHPQQGYHVKVTVNTPFSKGSDVKHKVFWVEPCTTASSSQESPSTSEPSPAVVAGTESTRPAPDKKPAAQAAPAGTVLGAQAAALPTAVASGHPGADASTAELAAGLLVAAGLALFGAGSTARRRTRGSHQV